MKNITKKLKELVKDEATKLRKHATKKERSRLDYERFNPHFGNTCVYGLMTGRCRSVRAFNLLNACAVPFADTNEPHYITQKAYSGLKGGFAYDVFSPIDRDWETHAFNK